MSLLDHDSYRYIDYMHEVAYLNRHPMMQSKIGKWGPIVQVSPDPAYQSLVAMFANGMKQMVTYSSMLNYEYQQIGNWSDSTSTACNTVPDMYYSVKIDTCCTPDEADKDCRKQDSEIKNTRRKTKLCLCSEHLWK